VSEHGATVYVGNLPWSTSEEDLARLFGQFTDVVGTRVVRNQRTGRPRDYGFVELARAEQVAAVCAALDRCQFNGRRLEVRPARARPDRR
jgi:RNA recognition motif-containing protein